LVLRRVRLIRVRLVLDNLNPINDTYILKLIFQGRYALPKGSGIEPFVDGQSAISPSLGGGS